MDLTAKSTFSDDASLETASELLGYYGRPALYFCPVVSFFFIFSPNLSGRRLDVYHTSTHGVALVRI